MEHFPGFRDRGLAELLTKRIRELEPRDPIKICHVCGTHEWTITHTGLRHLLPENVSLIAGPGCPVCIVPAREIDEAIWLSLNGANVVTFGDMYRAPGSETSLEDAKSQGGEVRVVYSVKDAVEMATREPSQEFVFFAIGFETTTPMNAVEAERCPEDLSFLVSHRLIPPALDALTSMADLNIDGFIAPGHVSTVIGMKPYHPSQLTRFRTRVGPEGLERIIVSLVEELIQGGLIRGETVAMDATFIKAYSKRDSRDNRQGASNPDAMVGRNGRSYGLGYKAHIAADVNSDLPLAFIAASAIRKIALALGSAEDEDGYQGAVFDVAKEEGIRPGNLFRILYKILLGSPQGPRFGPYVDAVGRDNVVRELKNAVSTSLT